MVNLQMVRNCFYCVTFFFILSYHYHTDSFFPVVFSQLSHLVFTNEQKKNENKIILIKYKFTNTQNETITRTFLYKFYIYVYFDFIFLYFILF